MYELSDRSREILQARDSAVAVDPVSMVDGHVLLTAADVPLLEGSRLFAGRGDLLHDLAWATRSGSGRWMLVFAADCDPLRVDRLAGMLESLGGRCTIETMRGFSPADLLLHCVAVADTA